MTAVAKRNKPRIMIVTAGPAQAPLILKAKTLGEVLVTDFNAGAPALALADRAVIVDSANPDEILRVAKEFEPQAIVTEQTDVAVASVAFAAERLGLPGIGQQAALRATDKWHLREACRKAGIAEPRCRLAQSVDEAIAASQEICLPVILKPADNQASRGVTKVYDHSRLQAAARNALAASRSSRIVVEELLLGSECSVESFVSNGRVRVLAIGEKTMCKPPHSYGLRQVYPAAFPEATLAEIQRLNETVIRTAGISMGFSHAEMIVTNDGVRLIEIAARGCGVRVATQLLPRMCGVDLLDIRLRQAMGETVSIPDTNDQAGMFRFFELPEGTVHRIEGIDKAASLDGVIHLEFRVPLGGRVVTPVNADERPGFVLAVAPTRADVIALTEKVMNIVNIEVA